MSQNDKEKTGLDDRLRNNVVCTSSTYTIENLPISAAVNWSALPTGFVTLNPGPAGSVTITRVGTLTGNVTLNATYTCGSFVSASLVVSIGTPPLSITSTRNGCSGQYQQWNIINNTPTNGSNWSWSVGNLGTNSQITIFSQSSPSTALSVKGGGAVRLNYTDLCSAARTDGVTVYSTCGGSFSVVVSPNPAQDNINLSFTQPDDGKTSIVAKTSAIPLQIIKSKGKTIMSLFEVSTNMLVKQWKYNESKSSNYSLNVNGLRKGVYVLQVDRDDLSEMIKILIE